MTKVEFLQNGEGGKLGKFKVGQKKSIDSDTAKTLKERGVVKFVDEKVNSKKEKLDERK